MNNDRLLELIDGMLEERLAQSDQTELARMLRESATARNVYWELVQQDVLLQDLVRESAGRDLAQMSLGESAAGRVLLGADVERLQRGSGRTRRWVLASGFVAAIILLMIGAFVWNERLSQDALRETLAQVRDLEGDVTIIRSTETVAAQVGDVLRPGDRLRTDKKNGRAVLEYVDGTTVELHFDSAVQAPADGEVRLRLLSGSIEVDAAPQPDDRPLVFATDHARYVVLGTHFRLYRNEDSTRLELNEGKVRLERQKGGRIVETVEVEAGNAAIASADARPVELVPLATGRARLHKTLTVTGQDAILSPAGDLLVVNDGGRGLTVCRSDDFTKMSEYKRDVGPSYGLAFGPDGQSVVRLSHDHVLVWKSDEPEARKLPLPVRLVRSRALSPDGRFIAESSDEGIEFSSIDLAVGDLKPVMVLPNRNGKSGKAWCLAFSQDGSRLAAGFYDGTLRVYSLDVERIGSPSYKVASEIKLAGTILPAAISGDGRYLAAFTRAGGLQLIDTVSGEQHTLWSSAGAIVGSLRFTLDGRWLMAGCSDRTARLWSVADNHPLLVIDADHLSGGMVWMPGRRWLVTADGSVKVWAIETPIPKQQTNKSQ